YSLYLKPDLENLVTTGKEQIEIEVLKPAKQLVLNALDLEVTRASLTLRNRELSLAPQTNTEAQTVTFALAEPLDRGKYTLTINYTGHLREQAQGLYYVRSPTDAGKKLMLCSQMEATDARRMFPCWDEPVFRASFELTIVVPEKHVPVS